MKSKHFRLLVALAMCTMTMTAFQCDTDKEPYVTKVRQTHCNEHFDTFASKDLGEGEQFDVRWDQGVMRVTHIGWMVPCDWRDVTVDVSVEGSTVIVNECCDGGNVNCICSIDNTFLITHMSGGTYTFIFQMCGEEVHRQEFTLP